MALFPGSSSRSARAAAAAVVALAITSSALALPPAAGAEPTGPDDGGADRGLVVVALDHRFGTVRALQRLDGFLTEPSAAAPADVALDFVRSHLDELGLSAGDLASLHLRQDYVDVGGTHHLSWTQRARGLDAMGVGLEVAVTADGRVASVTGPVAPGLEAPHGRFLLDRTDAIAAARSAAGAARIAPMPLDRARRVLFPTPAGGARLAWKARVSAGPARVDLTVVDGRTGRVLARRNTVVRDQVGSGLAWPNYPSETLPSGGGDQAAVTFPVVDATALSGNNAHVFTDVLASFDDPRPQDEVPAVDAGTLSWSMPAVLEDDLPSQNCTADFLCTWDSTVPRSWRTNRVASATSTYWMLNHLHDWLEAAPIGFTEAAGNFQVANDDGQGGLDGDPMVAHALFGAKGRRGLPDWVNNAFISPTPDGWETHMATLLFREEDYRDDAPFGPNIPSSDSGVDALIVTHEYLHGVSHRLVTTADGEPALGGLQAGAMGEAWGDWFGLALVDAEGTADDGPGVDVPVGEYVTGGDGIRYQFADCRVDSDAADCPEPNRGVGPGGYTYGDLGLIAGFREVHADGEIWLQTLWELRGVLGHLTTIELVTRAMELSPPNPTFLDMRNAILLADTIANAGTNHEDIWQVFATRGMGFFAESKSSVRATEDFSLPVVCPSPACGRLQGTVTDAATETPVAGATVTISGSATGLPIELSATTDADGAYEIADVPNHRYARVTVHAPGYLSRTARDVRVSGTAQLDAELERNWAQLDGGATITRQVGVDDPDCPVTQALDGEVETGWSTRRADGRRPSITLALPQAVDVARVSIAPMPCTRRVREALRAFTIFTRRASGSWTKALVSDASLIRRAPVVSFRLDRGDGRVSQIRLVLRGSEPGGRRRVVGLSEFRVLGSAA